MFRHLARRAACALLGLLVANIAAGAERSEIPSRYKWDLTHLYPSRDAWNRAKADLERRIPTVDKFRGHLGESPAKLADALDAVMDIARDLQRLRTYAAQLADEDTRVADHLAMRESAGQLSVSFASARSYLRPEILALGEKKVREFIAAEPRLARYRVYLDDILRYAPHTLGAGEEKVAAEAGRMAGAGNTIRDVFNNAELPFPTVTLSDGKQVRLDDAAYTLYRQAPSRADRDTVFQRFWTAHREFQGSYAAMLDAGIQTHVFNKNVRKFSSCLEASLFGDNIPTRVYSQLIKDVHASFPTLHRYLKLRKRMMGVDRLRYEDLYAPIVPSVALSFTPEQASELTLAAVAPLGLEYVDTLRQGFSSGWVDWLPSTGKSSGAYSTGAYGVHPYQLQNFTGKYDEVGTLAHESGHSMHTFYSYASQPFVTADYATFVAEVASTLNENLLFHHMLGKTQDTPTRLFLLGSYLDNLRGTLFRQTLFAEFELLIHERAERGETLTGESLSQAYLNLVRTYYGHAQNVCRVDSLYGVEWTYIPHFYFDFYVYQYATSVVASTALANGIREDAARGATTKRDAYLRLLKSGSSKYPIDLLKDAGVDMTTSAPFQASMKEMNRVMDEIEKLLASTTTKPRNSTKRRTAPRTPRATATRQVRTARRARG